MLWPLLRHSLLRSGGRHPVPLRRCRAASLRMLASAPTNSPVMSLSDRSTSCRLARPASEAGSGPDSWFCGGTGRAGHACRLGGAEEQAATFPRGRRWAEHPEAGPHPPRATCTLHSPAAASTSTPTTACHSHPTSAHPRQVQGLQAVGGANDGRDVARQVVAPRPSCVGAAGQQQPQQPGARAARQPAFSSAASGSALADVLAGSPHTWLAPPLRRCWAA